MEDTAQVSSVLCLTGHETTPLTPLINTSQRKSWLEGIKKETSYKAKSVSLRRFVEPPSTGVNVA